MPELPEVETVRRGLEPVMLGEQLTHVVARRPDLRFPFPERFAERLTGARVDRVERRAKFLTLHLDTGETLISHLGMSGRYIIEGTKRAGLEDGRLYAQGALPQHDHVVFALSNGARVIYNDPRRFGYMDLCATQALGASKHFIAVGPEPLGNDFSAPVLKAALKGKSVAIKNALLDQRVVAGLGNIYVCEALHRAGIHPNTKAGKISVHRLEPLVQHIREVLDQAIVAGGSTLRDFASADGALGYFQHRFAVYGREGLPCQTPGCGGTVRRVVHSGRSSFYCPVCQR